MLRLERQHGALRLEAACARTLLLGSATYQTVGSILQRRIENLAVSDKIDWAAPDRAHVRGAKYYQ